MTKKIVLKVQLNCNKCRLKAWKLLAKAEGIVSIAIEGEDNDQFVVTGNGVDSVKLATKLRKNVGNTNIVGVSEVKEEKKKEAKIEIPKFIYDMQCYPNYYPNQQFVVHDGNDGLGPSCSIL